MPTSREPTRSYVSSISSLATPVQFTVDPHESLPTHAIRDSVASRSCRPRRRLVGEIGWRRGVDAISPPSRAGASRGPYCPDARDPVTCDLEGQHRHSDAVLLSYRTGLIADRTLQDCQVGYFPATSMSTRATCSPPSIAVPPVAYAVRVPNTARTYRTCEGQWCGVLAGGRRCRASGRTGPGNVSEWLGVRTDLPLTRRRASTWPLTPRRREPSWRVRSRVS